MFFTKLKEKAISFWNKAKNSIWNVIDSWAKKLQESWFVLKRVEDLNLYIEKSKDVASPTWKIFKRRVIIIFAEKDTDLYRSALYEIPILYTKTWSQNIELKMCSIPLVELENFSIKSLPCVVVYENRNIYKVINGEENINKLVKWLTLDINKTIDEIE